MSSLVGIRSRSHVAAARARAQALAEWRTTAGLVRARWAEFLVADRGFRAGAFARFVAALDLEQAAASALARVSTGGVG